MRGYLSNGSLDKIRHELEVADAPGKRIDSLDSIAENLKRAGELGGPFEPRGSMQSWRETLYTVIATGTQVSNTTTETILIPDFTLPAGYLYPGRTLKYTLFGDYSTVITTPGTIIHSLRYGGVAGTVLAKSDAFAPDPTAASTTLSWVVEYYFVCRAVGAAAASFTMSRMILSDFDDASATALKGNLDMTVFGVAGNAVPAAVNINTTTANALSPTVKHSVATAGTNSQCHIAVLEALT